MKVNIVKSSFLVDEVDENFKNNLMQLFHYKIDPLEIGFKYLGFFLKDNNYHKAD